VADDDKDRLVDLIYQRVERDFPFPPALQARWDAALDAVVAGHDSAAEERLDALVAAEPEMQAILQQRARKAAAALTHIEEGATYDVDTDSWRNTTS
jgi:hypothetical protein